MGPVIVNTTSYQHLTVANDGICDLQYKLIVEQFVNGPYGDDDSDLTLDNEAIGIQLQQS